MAADLFEDSDRYKLLATKIWPLLAQSREELAECYTEDNGRPGIEPVVLLGVLIFQFLERVPDRQAAELVKYHLGSGIDCLRLLQWLEPLGTEIGQGRQIVLLREIFAQHYVVKQGGEIDPVKVHATGVVQNPHDPDAQWSAKGQGKQRKEWVGYKVQVAETVASQGDQSSFISSVVTQRATESDDAGLPATLQKQEALGFDRPAELYADGAYISGRVIDQAKEEGWQLMGPAQPTASRAGLEKAYRIEAFDN